MEKRRLGRSDLAVSSLCLGGNVFGWSADEKASFAVLDAFVEAGLNFVDTADIYSAWAPGNRGGESETIIGRWLKARGGRDRIVLTTKLGMEMAPGKKGLSAAYVREAVEASLRRLQTEYIDLYLSHFEDPEASHEETMGAYAELIKAGKVRAVGCSNYSVPSLREALAASAKRGWPRYDNLQTNYNLYDRAGYEAELEGVCREHEIGVTSYYSLAKGFLSGKYRSEADLAKSATRGGSAKAYLNPRGLRILSALDEVAADLEATPAQVAIAWLIGRPGLTAAIASATSVEQLGELVAATRLELSPAQRRGLDEASRPDAPA